MPHIRIDRFDPERIPFTRGGVEFLWYAKNLEHPEEGLVGVRTEGVEFLLQLKPKGGEWLLKAEKISRPSPNTLVKKALQAYVDEAAPNVLFSNIANVENAPLKAPHPCLKEIASFDPDQLPAKPLWIEVGFGSGRHLLHQARTHPDVHLIGLEIHRPSLEQVMRHVAMENLTNLWLIDYDARLFMELLPSDRVERIFVHFPVPWDKKPHRRVISDLFTREALRVLRPGGSLELRTDSENYYRYAMEVFTRPERVRLQLEKNAEAAVRSKYEDRWRRMNKNIYQIDLYALDASAPRRVSGDFSFGEAPTIEAFFRQWPKRAIVREECFVHFERVYGIDAENGLIRLSFGSFDRPEHKYILIREGEARYYPHPPVATATNLEAHRLVKEYLCPTL